MRKLKVKYSFTRLSPGELVEFSRSSIQKMTGNPYFTNPEVPLTEIGQVTDELENNYKISRKGGGRAAAAHTQSSRQALIKLHRKQANYINNIADGDEFIILSSGYEPTKVPAPAIHPVFNAINGSSPGQVILLRQAVKGATAYLWQFFKGTIPTDEKLWVFAGASSQAKCVIENLDSLNNYWFRVAPVLRKGDLIWSEPIMETVL
jgi:hypothetical protein